MPRSANPPPPRDNPIVSFPRKRERGRLYFSCPGGGKLTHRRSCMLRWHASAKATSRMPAAKSQASGAPDATWRDTVRIAIGRKRRRFAPPLAVIGADVLHHAEMGDRRRLRNRLHVAAMQPRDRRAFRAIDLQRKQIVAPH